jgi:hypothetical protein
MSEIIKSQTVMVEVPEGLHSGSDLMVQTEDGRVFSIVVPPGF